MTMTKKHKPTSAVVTLPDPEGKPICHHAEEGGTLEIRSESVDYPTFEVKITGAPHKFPSPLTGSTSKPVVIPIPPKSEGQYSVAVTHQHGDGTQTAADQNFNFSVHPCNGC